MRDNGGDLLSVGGAVVSWQVGDIAVCVDLSPRPTTRAPNLRNLARLALGQVYRVSFVGVSPKGTQCLRFAGVPHDDCGGKITGWRADRFRKIRPDEHEGNAATWDMLLEECGHKQPAKISEEAQSCHQQ